MNQFQKGDQVHLKSGGPLMTIQELGDFSINDGIVNGAKRIWFDGNKPIERVFDVTTLEKYIDDEC